MAPPAGENGDLHCFGFHGHISRFIFAFYQVFFRISNYGLLANTLIFFKQLNGTSYLDFIFLFSHGKTTI